MLQLGEQEECFEGVVAVCELSVAVEYKKKTKSKAKEWNGQIFFVRISTLFFPNSKTKDLFGPAE